MAIAVSSSVVRYQGPGAGPYREATQILPRPVKEVVIQNTGSVVIYFGDVGVSSINYGFSLSAGERIVLSNLDRIYAITLNTIGSVRVFYSS